jgi:single-strand DNA-binding protein
MAEALYGNLTSDPELRFTPSGTAVANLRVAHTDRVKVNGTWQDGETSFHDVVVWRQQAENVADALGKGDRIVAVGAWKTREWESADGETHNSTEFVADEIGPSLKFGSVIVK